MEQEEAKCSACKSTNGVIQNTMKDYRGTGVGRIYLCCQCLELLKAVKVPLQSPFPKKTLAYLQNIRGSHVDYKNSGHIPK